MKTLLIALMASAAALTTHAQNLVPNPSFEEYVECPFSTAELDNQVVDWYSWQMTPDFFHSCSDEIDGFASTPENPWGYQWPITGQGYAALFTFVDINVNEREYIASELLSPLVNGQEYYLLFHVSLCDGGVNITRKCANNNLGMRFFKNPSYSDFPPDQSFQADNFAHLNHDQIITDDENWLKIEGWFTADDAYNWVAIGNFFDDQNTSTLVLNDEDRCWGVYYIENVCVSTDPAQCEYLLSNRVEVLNNNTVKVYPNPASSHFNIKIDAGRMEQAIIYDSQGKVILKIAIGPTSSMTIDISKFQKGFYVLRIQTNNQIFNQKIIIK